MPDIRITREEIEKIATLAALALTEEEKARLVSEFQEILDYFRKIDAVPLPDLHDRPADTERHLRDDVVEPSGQTPEAFSPYLEDGHFKVPRVIE